MSGQGLLESYLILPSWAPGDIPTPDELFTVCPRFYHYGGTYSILMQSVQNNGGVTAILKFQYSQDDTVWTTAFESAPWVPGDGELYSARVGADQLPKIVANDIEGGTDLNGYYARWALALTGGASLVQAALCAIERLVEAPSIGQPTAPIRGVSIHRNVTGTGNLEQDAAGQNKIRFDLA